MGILFAVDNVGQRAPAVGVAVGAGADVLRHVERSVFEMVAHVVLEVGEGQRSLRLDPERECLPLGAHNVGQVFVHLGFVGVVAEERPHTAVAAAGGADVEHTVGFREVEVFIFPAEIAFLAGEGDHVFGIERFGVFEREFMDSREVGVTADAVVGDAAGYPYRTFLVFSLADELHDPCFVGVGDAERFA